MKEFVNICKKSQKDLKSYAYARLSKTHSKVIADRGYIFAQGSFPVLLVAHLDTVHINLPTEILYDTETGAISAKNGIGGDDRCGVYMILEIVKKHNCSVLFCEDEEIGGIGAKDFTESKLAKGLSFNYIIELDRKGSNDAVFYDCGNDEFTKFITKSFYKKAYGTFSDISIIAPALKCAAVNLSCGYYKAHTKDEYVVFSQMIQCIKEVCKILDRTTQEDKFEYIIAEYTYYSGYAGYGSYSGYDRYYNYGSYDRYGNYYSSHYKNDDSVYSYFYITYRSDIIKYYTTYATSKEEAIGKCMIDNPSLTYNDIVEVCDLDDIDSYSR
jgi:hypothetical protein